MRLLLRNEVWKSVVIFYHVIILYKKSQRKNWLHRERKDFLLLQFMFTDQIIFDTDTMSQFGYKYLYEREIPFGELKRKRVMRHSVQAALSLSICISTDTNTHWQLNTCFSFEAITDNSVRCTNDFSQGLLMHIPLCQHTPSTTSCEPPEGAAIFKKNYVSCHSARILRKRF